MCAARHAYAAVSVQSDALGMKPCRWIRQESERDDHRIGGNGFFSSRHGLGNAAAFGSRRTQPGFDQLHALHAIDADNFHRLSVEQEIDALFLAVPVVAPRSRHVGFVAAVSAGHAGGPLANCGSIAIHAGVAAAQHHDALTLHVQEVRPITDAQFAIDVRNEIGQRFVNPRQIFTVETAFDVGVGAHAQEYRVELALEFLERDVATDIRVQPELDTHGLHDFTALLHDVFFQLERRYAESQKAPDLGIAIEDHRRDAIAHQNVRAGEACRARPYHSDTLVRSHHMRQVRLPAKPECFVRDVFFDGAYAHRAQAIVERARAFA